MKIYEFEFTYEENDMKVHIPFDIRAEFFDEAKQKAEEHVAKNFQRLETEFSTIRYARVSLDVADFGELQDPCEYCRESKLWTAEDYQTFYDDGTEVRISMNKITFGYRSPFYDDAFENKYTISFCPMCGRKLEEII